MKIRTINECEIKSKIFHRGRWYVNIEPSFNLKDRIPLSQYNWLSTNPSFLNIPRGYVIHHLDWDETNDDPSNLVLMKKELHTAYHFKLRNTKKVPVQFAYDGNLTEQLYFPKKEPKIYKIKKTGKYSVVFSEKMNGKSIRKTLCKYMGKTFFTQEDAERAKWQIWGQYQSE